MSKLEWMGPLKGDERAVEFGFDRVLLEAEMEEGGKERQ